MVLGFLAFTVWLCNQSGLFDTLAKSMHEATDCKGYINVEGESSGRMLATAVSGGMCAEGEGEGTDKSSHRQLVEATRVASTVGSIMPWSIVGKMLTSRQLAIES